MRASSFRLAEIGGIGWRFQVTIKKGRSVERPLKTHANLDVFLGFHPA